MDKIGFQKHIYQRLGLLFHTKSWPSQLLERLLLRPQSPASGISDCPLSFPEAISEGEQSSQLPEPTAMVTVGVLDLKLHTLLHNLTQNITKEVWKIEEDNTALKHTVSQIQLQQEDLENREQRQNLRIHGVPETISDKEIHLYLLGLFVTLAPHIPEIDWRLDRAHRSLAPWNQSKRHYCLLSLL